MSTRSDIIAICSDGKFRRIYCHWNGYLSHNGKILFDAYTDQKRVDALMALGNLSTLGPEIGKKHDFDWHSKLYKKLFDKKIGQEEYARQSERGNRFCLAYGRDRGETNWEAVEGESLAAVWPENDTWTEFTYVWDGDKWWCGDPDEGSQALCDLAKLLLGEKVLRPKIKMFGGFVLGRHSGKVGY